jgi:hypothetical protein
MRNARKFLAQALFYGAFAAFIGYFSTSPAYQHLPGGTALLRLSFSHPAKLTADCRKRTAEELAKVPANMRVELDCPRERSPVAVRIELDGQTLIDETFPPAGLHKDGAASAYRRMPITAGPHQLLAQFNDDARVQGFNYVRVETIDVKPGQIVLIDFTAERGGIVIR